jgi:hypothetical protein
MSIVDRVKNICLTPNSEWPVIANETSSTGGLLTGYVAPLAAIGAIAGFIGASFVGTSTFFAGTYRMSVLAGLALAVWTFVGAIIGVLVVGFIINALAPSFGATKDLGQAMKVAAYSFTPGWVAGILRIVPALGILAILGGLYGLYLLYLGLPALMKAPKDKAAGYTVVTVIAAIVVSVVISVVGGVVVGVGALTSGALGGVASSRPSSSDEIQFDKNSPLGKLQEFGKAMEESNKKMEAAQKSGDSQAAANAAMETLGTLLGGGKRVDPLDVDQIKSFLPPTLAGFQKQGNGSAEKTGFAALMVSKAEANYSDGSRTVTVEISDSGGASGLMGLASWATMQTTKEDENGSERVSKVNGRMVHEKTSKNGSDEFEIVVGDRFLVGAHSSQVKLDDLRKVVGALDLKKIESMKDVGVKK